MKRRLMEILACPMCRNHPLELIVFSEENEIDEGIIICNSCNRWYPIKETIPHMLPDELREMEEDTEFLRRWEDKVPKKIVGEGKPFNLFKKNI
ncbi:MAG: Trm112 family protein [Candidatus Verstraetearchaeota archaeon]|nr:Trm112 family protein [Candidatus Verstraetearchaeota archaeon]